MSYVYDQERPYLFTEDGQVDFLKVRDKANELLKIAGAFKAPYAWSTLSVYDTWAALACLDRLVELGELREISVPDCRAQDRVFVKPINR